MAKLHKLTSTDGDPEVMETNNPRYIQFARDMDRKKIPWQWYSGRFMYGAHCPGVVTQGAELTTEMVIRATTVTGLKQDSFGRETVIYPGV